MTRYVKQDQEEFEKQLVSAKLSGDLLNITVPVSWELYQYYCECVHESAHGEMNHLKLELQDVISSQDVFAKFMGDINESVNYFRDEGIQENFDTYQVARSIFKEEFKAAQIEEKRILEEHKRKAEEIRIAMAKAKEEAEANGINIKVDKKNHKKALAILVAAGLVKA